MIRVKLDGNVVTTPENWKELTSKIKREDAYNGLLIYQESEVEFTDDGYDYLLGKLNDEGFCSVVEVTIERSCDDDSSFQLLLRGKIFISDVSYNERTCRASAKIEDTSFFSLIKNNGKIKTALDTFLTKNGLPITTYTPYLVDFYDVPSNSLQVAIGVPTVSIYDAFAYMISFMSDNEVGFASTLFGPGGDWEGLCVTTGKRIRLQTPEAWEQISFNELFEEVMAATEELKLIVEDPYGSPTIRIERASYTYGNPITLTLTDVYEINTSCMTEKLYTSVNVGSQVLEDNIAYAFPEDIDYFGFKTEELFLQGKCNVDNSLDITGNWVRSSNVLEKALGPSTDYDNNIVLLDTEVQAPGAGRTTNTNTFDLVPPYYFYNDRLRNSEIMSRWVGGLPGSIVKYLGAVGDGIFEATKTLDQTLGLAASFITPITFTNEVTDVGNYYDATDTFTAAVTATYFMHVNALYTLTFAGGSTDGWVRYSFKVYDSGANLKYTKSSPYQQVVSSSPSGTIDFSTFLVMNAGDYAQVFVNFNTVGSILSTVTTSTGSLWECTENTVGGGVFQTIDPADYPVLLHEFEYPITEDQFALLVADPTARIQFGMNNQAYRAAWIDDISYNHITKLGSFKLVTSRNAN
jgi:hypothetical protein